DGASGDSRKALNSANETAPSLSVQPPVGAQRGSVGSQSSQRTTSRFPRCFSFSAATSTVAAATTSSPTDVNNDTKIPIRRILPPLNKGLRCAIAVPASGLRKSNELVGRTA